MQDEDEKDGSSSYSTGLQKLTGKSNSDKFLGAKFRGQMKQLMVELKSCDLHFIRCIKPNEEKKKGAFIHQFIMLQIRYLGILESVRVRREGFPSRMEYELFYRKYHEIDDRYRYVACE